MCQWQLGSETYVVISVPAYDTEAADALTVAEHDIVSLILLGQTYDQIAQARGSCSTTVTNQIRAIFEKLGVDSKAQLAQKLAPVSFNNNNPSHDPSHNNPSHNDRDG